MSIDRGGVSVSGQQAAVRADYQQVARQLTRAASGTTLLRLTVIGDSMRPLLRAGDVVVVQPQEPYTLQVGQVLVVQRGGEWITHRLQAVDAAGWYTQGDNTRTRDVMVNAEEIIGWVIAVERGSQTLDLRSAKWSEAGRRIVNTQRAQLWLLDQARHFKPRWLNARLGGMIAAGLSWPFTGLTRLVIWLTLRQNKGQSV